MPIWVFVIEHPEGLFVIDTGENARVNDPGYFKPSGWFENWFNTTQFRFSVNREEEIDQQMEAIGLSCDQVDTVILSHLHLDHIDGLHHFPNSEIKVNRLEWEKPFGDLPNLYPDWLDPTLLDLDQTYGPFPRAKALTDAYDLWLLETTGHTYGHCSILLKTEEANLFFAIDVVYRELQLKEGIFSAATVDKKAAAETYNWVKELLEKEQILILPSHEEEVLDRLKEIK